MQEVRQRRQPKPIIKVVKDLDIFTKTSEECVQTTSYGGGASIFAIIVILWLVILEVNYFLDYDYKFHFSPDTDLDTKLAINVDISVAMPCGVIGADIVDSTNQNVVKFGELQEDYIHFELTDEQRAYFNMKSNINKYLREESHLIRDLIWKRTNFLNFYSVDPGMPESPKRTNQDTRGPKQSCRIHGKLQLNKVAGNFHITAGKTLPLSRGHAHISPFMSDRDYNFSHRISQFSFGDELKDSIILPLEGDERIAHSNHMLYTYFIQVVPTLVKTRFRTYQTYQYSVRELEREIDHDKGSHGVSGIFFKYDMSGLKVEVTEESESIIEFLVRLCAIIGGVYTTIGMFYNHLSFLGCRVFKGEKDDREKLIPNTNINNPLLQNTSIDTSLPDLLASHQQQS